MGVWRVVTDFGSYSKWNPFLVTVAGACAVGSRCELAVRMGSGDVRRFAADVTLLAAGRALRWRSVWGAAVCLEVEQGFTLEPLDKHTTLFIYDMRLWGALAPVAARSFEGGLSIQMARMNKMLRAMAETRTCVA